MNSTFAILVIIDLVNSTKYFEKVGDKRASEAMRVYDRIFRGLLIKYDGLEIDKTDGALLIFESMREALMYCKEYHSLVEKHVGLKSRVGIHCGVVMMHSNHKAFVARGAKPVEVDGIHKNICARIMSLAGGGQTLLSKTAGEYASASSVRGGMLMANLGTWKMKGVKAPMKVYAVGANLEDLRRPKETDKVKLVIPPKMTSREKWMRFFKIFVVFPLSLVGLYAMLLTLVICEEFQIIDRWGFKELWRFLESIPPFIRELLGK